MPITFVYTLDGTPFWNPSNRVDASAGFHRICRERRCNSSSNYIMTCWAASKLWLQWYIRECLPTARASELYRDITSPWAVRGRAELHPFRSWGSLQLPTVNHHDVTNTTCTPTTQSAGEVIDQLWCMILNNSWSATSNNHGFDDSNFEATSFTTQRPARLLPIFVLISERWARTLYAQAHFWQ